MRRHMWMHVGLLAAILAVFGLSAIGVAIPTFVVYLIVLACPLMMVFMMLGMQHDHEGHGSHDHEGHASQGCCSHGESSHGDSSHDRTPDHAPDHAPR